MMGCSKCKSADCILSADVLYMMGTVGFKGWITRTHQCFQLENLFIPFVGELSVKNHCHVSLKYRKITLHKIHRDKTGIHLSKSDCSAKGGIFRTTADPLGNPATLDPLITVGPVNHTERDPPPGETHMPPIQSTLKSAIIANMKKLPDQMSVGTHEHHRKHRQN